MIDLDKLEADAKRASAALDTFTKKWPGHFEEAIDFGKNLNSFDARHIANMDPAMTLALIERLRAAEAKVEKALTQAQFTFNLTMTSPYDNGAADQAYKTIEALGEES